MGSWDKVGLEDWVRIQGETSPPLPQKAPAALEGSAKGWGVNRACDSSP